MTGDRTNYIEIDLLQLLKALRRRVWAILLATVLFGGAAFTYATVFITPRYQASALMYVNNSSFFPGEHLLQHQLLGTDCCTEFGGNLHCYPEHTNHSGRCDPKSRRFLYIRGAVRHGQCQRSERHRDI